MGSMDPEQENVEREVIEISTDSEEEVIYISSDSEAGRGAQDSDTESDSGRTEETGSGAEADVESSSEGSVYDSAENLESCNESGSQSETDSVGSDNVFAPPPSRANALSGINQKGVESKENGLRTQKILSNL